MLGGWSDVNNRGGSRGRVQGVRFQCIWEETIVGCPGGGGGQGVGGVQEAREERVRGGTSKRMGSGRKGGK